MKAKKTGRRAGFLLTVTAAALVAASGAAMAVESGNGAAPASNNTAAQGGSLKGIQGFVNLAPISIPGNPPSQFTATSGPASPYPSEITVRGFKKGSVITDVNLYLNHFSHNFPRDVDVLLVGPAGQNALVMSDVGSGSPVNDVTITLDDEAANPLDPFNAPTGGPFKPTDSDSPDQGDNFPSPAPTPSANTALSAFDGTNPNGTWKLYVVDDGEISTGQLAEGWSLGIQAKAPKNKKHKKKN